MMLTTLKIQLDDVATSEKRGSGGVQQVHQRGLMEQKLNPEMEVLSTFSVEGATAGFDQRRLGEVDPLWEEFRDHIAAFQGSVLVAKDGGCEVMTAGFFVGGIAVKRRGESGCCWLPGFGHETKSASAIDSPLSHLSLTSPNEHITPIRSGATQRGRIQVSGPGGNDTAPGLLHPPLGPKLWQSGTMAHISFAKRREGADLFDVGAKGVAQKGASSGQNRSRQSGALNKGPCRAGKKRGLSGQGFNRHEPDRGEEGL